MTIVIQNPTYYLLLFLDYKKILFKEIGFFYFIIKILIFIKEILKMFNFIFYLFNNLINY